MKKLFFALLVCGAPVAAQAQQTQDTVELNELVVTATRVPLAHSAVAASVTVLRGDELRSKGIRNVADALRTVSGAAVVQGGSYGAQTALFMRGGESDYVQVLIDGVQVNSPGELFDFGNLTLENIERIEVVRGPVSVLYGSDAVTGVVQLFTRQGAGRTHVDASASGGLGSRIGAQADGSFGSSALNADINGGTDRIGYGIGASHFRSAGAYAFNNNYDNTGLTARVSTASSAMTDLNATVRYSTSTFHYPTDGSGNIVDQNQYHTTDAISAVVNGGHRLTPRLEARAQVGFNRNDDSYNDSPDNAADNKGFYAFYSDERFQRETAELSVNYSLRPQSTITVGGEYEHQRERGWNRSESEFGPFTGESREERTNRAAFAQVIGAVSRVNLQAGARFEDNERFGEFATYRGGVSIPLTTALRVRASAGTGFKEPRFFEQFANGFVKGNPDLKPERSRSFEGGVELTRRSSTFGATYFSQDFKDMIQYVGAPANAGDPNYLNLAGAHVNGLELEATHTQGALGIRGAFTLLDHEVTDEGTGDDPLFNEGEKLIRRPDYTVALSLSYRIRRATLSASAYHVSERDDLDFSDYPAGRVALDAYTRLDAAAEMPIGTGGLRGTLKLENLLNAQYEEVFNFPARGRVIFIGARYTR
jgi:vitamin B12 transporter